MTGDAQPITGIREAEDTVLLIEPGASTILQNFVDELEILGSRWSFRHGSMKIGDRRYTWVETPIGGPNTEIVVNELAKLNARNFVRIGASGVADPNIALGDILIPTKAISACGVTWNYVGDRTIFSCSEFLLPIFTEGLESLKVPYHLVTSLSVDCFYGANAVLSDGSIKPATYGEFRTKLFTSLYSESSLRFHCIEMEDSPLYCLGKCLNLNTIAIRCGSDRIPWKTTREEEFDFQGAQRRLFEVVVEILPSIPEGMLYETPVGRGVRVVRS